VFSNYKFIKIINHLKNRQQYIYLFEFAYLHDRKISCKIFQKTKILLNNIENSEDEAQDQKRVYMHVNLYRNIKTNYNNATELMNSN
jgi:hypothetical protein